MPSLSMLRNAPAPLPSTQLRCSLRRPRDASVIAVSYDRRRSLRSDIGGERATREKARGLMHASAAADVAGDVAVSAVDRNGRERRLRVLCPCAPRPTRSASIAPAVGAASSSQGPTSNADEDEDSLTSQAEDCKIGFVTVDNESSRSCTKLRLEAADYIGLTRVVAWVLGGLGLLVRDARLTTGEDGWARNEFWVTTESGKKLSDSRASSASERLAEFVTYCTPPPRRQGQESRVQFGGITVDSSERAHARWTVVTVRGGGFGSGGGSGASGGGFGGASGRVGAISSFGPASSSSFSSSASSSSPLLDVASAVSGAGIAIREAIVMGGGPSCEDDDEGGSEGRGDGFDGVGGNGNGRPTIDDDPEDGEEGTPTNGSGNEPAMRLWVCEPATGGKLSYVRCVALLQTLSLALGRGGGPSLVPPAPVTLLSTAAGGE